MRDRRAFVRGALRSSSTRYPSANRADRPSAHLVHGRRNPIRFSLRRHATFRLVILTASNVRDRRRSNGSPESYDLVGDALGMTSHRSGTRYTAGSRGEREDAALGESDARLRAGDGGRAERDGGLPRVRGEVRDVRPRAPGLFGRFRRQLHRHADVTGGECPFAVASGRCSGSTPARSSCSRWPAFRCWESRCTRVYATDRVESRRAVVSEGATNRSG